jgi:predicted ABC-type transport system involved in lysophospholipase L1 biosynthesis ATPase subunit
VTGAALPDEGEITLFGTNTRHIPSAAAWLRSLDGLGLVSHRAVLVDMLTVLQNVAMPLTMDVDPIDPAHRPQAEALAREAGIAERLWDRALGHVDAETNLRVRLARAVAADPVLVIAEHPSATLPREAVARVASDVLRVVRAREAALVTLTADTEWAAEVGGDVLTLSPATGGLASGGGFVERFKRVFGGR